LVKFGLSHAVTSGTGNIAFDGVSCLVTLIVRSVRAIAAVPLIVPRSTVPLASGIWHEGKAMFKPAASGLPMEAVDAGLAIKDGDQAAGTPVILNSAPVIPLGTSLARTYIVKESSCDTVASQSEPSAAK
jgi:hypothetical protein